MAPKVLVLTVLQTAHVLECGDSTVRKWIKDGLLPSRIGDDGRIKVPLSALKKKLPEDKYWLIKDRLLKGKPPVRPMTPDGRTKRGRIVLPENRKTKGQTQ